MVEIPYVGLRSYDQTDQDRFHGRERESRDVHALWTGSQLLIVYGRSGAGKTSLLRAGVLPLVRTDEAEVLPLGRVSQGAAFPTTAMPRHNPYTFALLSSWSQASSPAALSGVSVATFLRQRPEPAQRYQSPVPLLAAIDQFEEFFGDLPHRQSYRDEFVAQLAEAVEAVPRLRLLISIREDFVARLLPHETTLGRAGRRRYAVAPLRPEAALRAVTNPLAGTGRSFAPGVAEKLVEDLRTETITNSLGETQFLVADTIEPAHLQLVCSTLWTSLPEPTSVISFQHLQDHGNIEHTLGAFCGRAVAEVATQHGMPESDLWEWLKRNFITDLGRRGTVYEGISTTGGMPNSVGRALEEHHILRAEDRAGSRWYELTHDRLIDPVRRGNRPWAVEDGAAANPSPAVYLRTAETALADGDLALADRYASDAIRLGGEQADPRTRAEAESFLAGTAAQRGRDDEAEDRFGSAAALFDTLSDQTAVGRVQAKLGRFLASRGRFAAAVAELQAASERLPGETALRVELADATWRAGQPRAAIGVLGTALTIAPDDTAALLLRGRIKAEVGDPTDALADLDNAVRLAPALDGAPEVVAARELIRTRSRRAEDPA
ncbi:MAG: tetratricopeptide repeat protein [Frankia sp.]